MVNLKYLVLPLLVGLLKVVKATGEEDTKTYPGYYKIKDNEGNPSDKIRQCTAKECTVIDIPKGGECSSEEDLGKLYLDGEEVKLCATNSIGFSDKEENYVVMHATEGDVFNFDRSKTFYLVKVTADAIYYDVTAETPKDYCADTDGKLISRKEDFCSSKGSGRYYTCKNGKCDSKLQTDYQDESNGEINDCILEVTDEEEGTLEVRDEEKGTCGVVHGKTCGSSNNGYHLLESGDLVLYNKDNEGESCTVISSPVDGYYWNDYQYNENVIMCVGSKCSEIDILDAECTDKTTNKLVDSHYKLDFCLGSNKEELNMITYVQGVEESAFSDTEKNYAIKRYDYSITVDVEVTGDQIVGEVSYTCEKGICSTKKKTIITIDVNNNNNDISCKIENYEGVEAIRFVNKEGNVVKDSENDGYLIKITKTSCNVLIQPKNAGYYINDSKMFKCDAGKCYLFEPTFENAGDIKYYLNSSSSDTNKLIKCDNGSGCEALKVKKESYYMDSSSDGLGLIYCTTTTCTTTSGVNRFAYLSNAYENDYSESIIICNNNECKNIDASEENVGKNYLNGGSNKSSYPLVVCNEEEAVKKWTVSTGKANKLFVNANAVSKTSKPFILCSSKTSCSEIDANGSGIFVDIDTKKLYKWDTEQWNNEVDLVQNAAYYVNSNFEIKLNNSGENGKLVYCKTVKKGDANEEKVCEVLSSLSTYYANAYDQGLIKTVSNVPEIVPESDIIEGYYINSATNIVECDNSKKCGLYTPVSKKCKKEEEQDGDDFKLITSEGKLCNKLGKAASPISLPSANTKYMLNVNEKTNLWNVNTKSVTVIHSTNENYLIDDDNKIQKSKNVKGTYYKCSTDGCVSKNDEGVYSNDDLATSKVYPLIKCDSNNECKGDTKGEMNIYCLIDNTLKLCKKCDTTTPECMEPNTKTGFYLNKETKSIISCNGGCADYSSHTKVGYYLSQDVAEPLIQCSLSVGSSIRCTNSTVNDGYYITKPWEEGDNYKVKLISCESGVCTEKEKPEGWYRSGENGKAIIYCKGEGEGDEYKTKSCISYAIPTVGYYVNGKGDDITGKYLIQCTKESSGVICKEVKPVITSGNKYYSNAAPLTLALSGNALIKCSTNECSTFDFDCTGEGCLSKYYVNGDNNQLIYCLTKNICSAYPIIQNQKSWFVNYDGTKLITCSNKVCSEQESSNEGYYLNSDPLTSFNKPIIKKDDDDGKWKVSLSDGNGWYLNADDKAINSEVIIRCTSPYSCGYRDLKNSACSNSIAGEFTKFYGKIKWCNGQGVAVELSDKVVVTQYKSNNIIPGVNLPIGNSEGYAVMDVKSNSIFLKNDKYNGYYYDGNGEYIYFCPRYKKGICTAEVLNNGYYVEYNNANIYKCYESNDKGKGHCDVVTSESCDENSNVIKSSGIELCKYYKSDSEKLKLSEIKSNEYALNTGKKGEDYIFPGSDSEYVRVNVEKYSVKLNENIINYTKCNCNNQNCKIKYDKDNKLFSCAIDNKYEYDEDTNYGFWLWDAGVVKKIFIPVQNEKGDIVSKLECNIGGFCLKQKLAPRTRVSYEVINGVLNAVYRDGGKSPVTPPIEKGSYFGENGSKEYFCETNGECKEKEGYKDIGKSFVGGRLEITLQGFEKPIKSSKKHSKFVMKKYSASSLRKRDGNEESYDEVLELTHASYTSSDETRNIFIYRNEEDEDDEENYMMITNQDKEIGLGYTCYKGRCSEIGKSSNVRYYLNTAQIGNGINCSNELVKCDSEKCDFVKFDQDLTSIIVENAASTGTDDAIISCNIDSGCQAVAVTASNGLPKCKAENGNLNIHQTEAGAELTDDQYCLYNGIPYGGSEELTEGIYMFDVTSRYIDHTKVKENHIYASLYNCKKISNDLSCTQTYGYIINNNDGYSICSSTGCEYKNYNDLKATKCEVVGNGGIIKDGQELKICLGDGKTITEAKDKIYTTDIIVNGSFPETSFGNKLLIGIKDNVAYTLIEDGYILLNKNNAIVSSQITEDTTNILYECNSENKNCLPIKNELKNYGYYKSPYSIKPIVCNDKGCGIDNIEVSFSEKEIIYTYKEDGFAGLTYPVISEASKMKIGLLIKSNYILLSGDKIATTEASKFIYLCSEQIGKCELKNDYGEDKIPYSGWYVSGDGINQAYKCASGMCSVVQKLSGTCSNYGDLVIEASTGLYKICDNKSKPSGLIESSGTIKTISIEKTAKNAFPDAQNVILINDNSVYGIDKVDSTESSGSKLVVNSSYVITECTSASNPCPNNLVVDSYCFGKGVLAIKKSDKCDKKEKNTAILLNGGKEAEVQDIGIGTKMYYCDKNESCRATSGYYLKGETWYRCDGTKCNPNTGSDSIGDINRSNQLVLGNNNFGSTSNKLNYYYINGNSNFPGTENIKSVLIEAGENYFVVFKGEGYYLINQSNEIENTDYYGNPDVSNVNEGEKTRRDSNTENKLYFCKNSDMSCSLNEKPLDGYYLNGDQQNIPNQKEYLAPIVCSNGNCIIAGSESDTFYPTSITEKEKGYRSIIYETSSCNEKTIGRLIRTKDKKTLKLCISKTQGEGFSNNEKYFVMSITSGNKFGSIAISNNEKNLNDKANIIVRIDNMSMTQYVNKGYILYSTQRDIPNVTSKTGTLYYCDEKSYLVDDELETAITVQCNEVSGINNGWYFNDKFKDNHFIECASNNCKIAEAQKISNCTSSGSLIYNDEKFKLCQTMLKQVEVGKESYNAIMNVSNMATFPSISANNTEIIVSVNPYNVTSIKWNSYKIVNPEDMKIIDKVTSDNTIFTEAGILYKCEQTGSCDKIELPNKNWYIKANMTGIATELIYCKGDSGSNCVVNVKPSVGYYVSSNKAKPIIQCIQTGLELDGIVDTENNPVICNEMDYFEGWMLNSKVSVDILEHNAGDIIKCTSENGCIEKSSEEIGNGWYINAGYNYGLSKLTNSTDTNNFYPLLKCTKSGGCEVYKEEIGKECKKGGEIVKISGKYKLCKSAKTTNFDGSVDFEKVTGSETQIVQIANYGDFPDADSSTGYILVNISKNEVIQNIYDDEFDHFVLKDRLMYKCNKGVCSLITDDNSNDKTVYEELSKTLYTGRCSNSKCEWTNKYNKEEIIFLDSDRKLFTNNSANEKDITDISYVYKCKKSSVCIIIYDKVQEISHRGYFINPYHYDNNNKKEVKTLYKYDEGNWSIVESETKCSPYNSNNNICYISYSDEKFEDELEEDGNMVKAGNMCETSNGKYYFAFEEVNTGIDKINCILMPTDSTVNYYKIGDEAYVVDQFSAYNLDLTNYINSITENIITKEFMDVFEAGIYRENTLFNGDNTITCNGEICTASVTAKCNYSHQKEKCKLISGSVNAGQTCVSTETGITYIALEKLSSAEGKCVRYNEERYYYPDDPENDKLVYYPIDGRMYKMNRNGDVLFLGEGVYIIDNANYSVAFEDESHAISVTSDSIYKIYVCNSEGCKQKNECNNGKDIEYIYDKIKSNVVVCNPETNTITRTRNPGYYLNKSSNDLIKCYANGECKEINSKAGMEGYYLNEGNEKMIIACKRDGDKFACVEEKLIECTFKESESLCSAPIDLYRNSYCYYSVIDKVLGKIEKLVYVENFIKTGSEGRCITGNDNEYFIHYKKSKFMGHEERSDLIKISKESIVSIFEPEIGYYIIDTKEGKGITKNTQLKKTRMYVCRKSNCTEERAPVDKEIYVNNASTEKLVYYNGESDVHIDRLGNKWTSGIWEIVNHKCEVDSVNTRLCKLDDEVYIGNGDLVYVVKNDEINISALIVEGSYQSVTVNTINMHPLIKKTFIKPGISYTKDHQYTSYYNDLYLYEQNMKSFSYKPGGNYYLNKYGIDNEDGEKDYYNFNLTPYKSTVNITSDKIGEYMNDYNIPYNEGYFINNADIDNEGVVLQYMLIPKKEKPENVSQRRKREGDDDVEAVIKAIVNKCTSKTKNICVNTDDGKITRGSPCVVTEGDWKGLYLAIADITKTSTTTNCVRYDSGISNVCNYNSEKGICTNAVDGKVLGENERCIVNDVKIGGVYKGEENKKNGKCWKLGSYDLSYKSYQYIGNGKDTKAYLFGSLYENELVEIGKEKIRPFRHDISEVASSNLENRNGIEYGYFIFDDGKTDGKSKFILNTQKSGTAYKCDYATEISKETEEMVVTGYTCETFTKASGYYYGNIEDFRSISSVEYPIGGKVYFGNNNKWKLEDTRGYYFFNKNYLPARKYKEQESKVKDDVFVSVGIGKAKFEYNGRYLNSAIGKNDNAVLIEYTKPDEDDLYGDNLNNFSISDKLKYCNINKDGSCSSTNAEDPLSQGDACYNNKDGKLYIVDIETVTEGEEQTTKTVCFTGSEILKYKFINSKLYQLDGLSIQEIDNSGYYILNEKLERFTSNYPEVPYKIINCSEGGCTELADKLNLDQTVMINFARNNTDKRISEPIFLRYYNEDVEKFMYLKDDYKCYCLNEEYHVPITVAQEIDYCIYSHGNCGNNSIKLNYASAGENMILEGYDNSIDNSYSYNKELDAIQYKNEYNLNSERVFKYINNRLYLLERRQITRIVDEGIYLMKDGKAFNSTEWTSFSGNSEICYNNYGGGCNADKMKEYRGYKYNINRAMREDTIVEYDDKTDMWRTVRDDGLYFFFEDEYAINKEDRRVGVVYQIVSGRVRKVFDKDNDSLKNNGFNIFNDLVVERSANGWEDGIVAVENVEVQGSKKCKAIETGELIENDELCYSSEKGLCVVKSSFSDTIVNDNNCMFGDNENYFYVIGNNLYMTNDKSYQKVVTKGMYVIDSENKAYDNKKEGQASAYSCDEEKCSIIDNLESQYYYNSASNNVLYYNSENGTWKKEVDEKKDFFFNENGYPVNGNEEVEHYIYENSKNIFISMSNPSKNILVYHEMNWDTGNYEYKVNEVPSCTVENGIIKSSVKMEAGDYCMDNGRIVFIKKEKELEKRQESEENVEYLYEVVISDENEKVLKYTYNEVTNEIIIIGNNGVNKYNVKDYEIEGNIIVNKETSIPITSTEGEDAVVYNCDKKKCSIIDGSKFTEGKRYINWFGKEKLLRFMGNGKWKVEDEAGYYFFDESGSISVGLNVAPIIAFEVYEKDGKMVQESIINNNIIGFFLNKASNNKYMINNNSNYYSKGMELHACNVTVIEDGVLCKTTNETITYEKGDYCYHSKTKQIYLLLDDATNTAEEANCIAGTNEKPKYIESSEFGSKLNGTEVYDRLIELSEDAIRIAKPGYYIVDGNYTLTDNNNDEDADINIFNCSDTKCEEVSILDEEKIITNDGTIYQMDEENKLQKVNNTGIYFFDSNGNVCKDEESEVSKIVEITEEGNKVLEEDALEEGVYINAGDKNSVGIYKDKKWSIKSVGCTYVENTGSCTNDDIELDVGSYCVVSDEKESKLYMIYEVKEDLKKCIPGNEEKPLYINNSEGDLLMVKAKSVKVVNDEGYYIYDSKTYEALVSEEVVPSKLIHCDGDKCSDDKPSIGSYLNRAPVEFNIAQYEDIEKEMAKTLSKSCDVSGEKCTTSEGSLVAGDVCIYSEALYLVESDSKCYKVENNNVRYQFISGKLYMLTMDSVIQEFNGYYFISKDNRAIIKKKDYSKEGVVAYLCSNKGDCYEIQPHPGRLYPDYTTKKGNNFAVVKYDPSKVSKRDGGSSGYEALSEEGIFLLDDGIYAECEFDNNDEISCHEIEKTGTYKSDVDESGEGTLINCTKTEEGAVECIQVTKGGYYVVENELMLCTPNEDKNQLVCSSMDKEGYFLSNSNGDLFECIEKVESAETASISSVYEKLNVAIAETIVIDESQAGIENVTKREEPANDQNANGEPADEQNANGEPVDDQNAEGEPNEPEPEVKPEPKDVECSVVKCEEEGELIKLVVDDEEGEKEIYLCKSTKEDKPDEDTNAEEEEEEEEEELKWVAQGECESYVKLGEYYKCEEEATDELEVVVPTPNKEHTSTVDNYTPTTTKSVTTSVTTGGAEEVPTNATTATSISSDTDDKPTGGKTNHSAPTGATTKTKTGDKASTSTTSTTTKTSTTSKQPSATTTTGGALSIIRSIPSFTFYLILFIFTYFVLN
ncbi:scaffoldin [Neocallimastix lanati (nom. inval.)]|nr:scaffoldin [Neocallimastix sp. JGI-2020a]